SRRAGRLRHARGGHRASERTWRGARPHHAVRLDECRRAHPARAHARRHAALRRARHPAPELTRTSMRLEIICTGDEVLTGKIVNTNFSYMSQKLEDVGLSLQWETTVGDDRESLLRAFQLAAERADAVIVNGGLGPTVDDLSQEVAAQAAGVDLVLNEEWLTRMEE